MIRQYQNIIGTPLVHFEKGNKLGFIQDVIIDPDRAKVEGFWVRSSKGPVAYPIVQTQDIVEWKKNIYIKNENVIADPAEVIRIKEILSKNRLIIGNNTQNEVGKNYGKVFDLTFNDKTYYLRDVHVQKSILGLFKFQRRIFPSSSIIEVLEKAVIIKDDNTEKIKNIETTLIKKDMADAGGLNRLEPNKKSQIKTR